MTLSTQPYRTSNDLVEKVLSILGVVTPGQTVEVEDFEKVNNNLDSIFRYLSALELVYVADPNNIPGEWYLPLAAIVAGEVCTDFGATSEDYLKFKNDGLGGAVGGAPILAGTAAMALKIMTRGRPTYEILQTESF